MFVDMNYMTFLVITNKRMRILPVYNLDLSSSKNFKIDEYLIPIHKDIWNIPVHVTTPHSKSVYDKALDVQVSKCLLQQSLLLIVLYLHDLYFAKILSRIHLWFYEFMMNVFLYMSLCYRWNFSWIYKLAMQSVCGKCQKLKYPKYNWIYSSPFLSTENLDYTCIKF